MAHIKLYFETKQVISSRYGNWPLNIIRLMAKVQFRLSDGYLTQPWEAILDTGAPLSVLPRSLWRDLEKEIHVQKATFGGISRRRYCRIRCSIGSVFGRLVDTEGNRSRIYDFPAFLAKTDRVPLILGFAELLEKFHSDFDYQSGEAWIEEH